MKITNGRLGILRVDLQTLPQGTSEWSDPVPHAFIYPGQTTEVTIGRFTRAALFLRAVERSVDPTCSISIESQTQLTVTVERAEEKGKSYVRQSIEHNCVRSNPYITLADRVIIESR
jgi:hypothetical protein